jgi:hypothetical protein
VPARRLLLDAGPLVALFNRNDRAHARAVTFFRGVQARFVTTWPVLTEAAHFLRPAQRASLLRLVDQAAEVVPIDTLRMAEILERFADQEADLADASLICAAESARLRQIVTLDVIDFGVYRIGVRGRFDLVEW